ncbi:MAG: anaerobic ribonucleoside-triphosphate reductase [Desulfobulbaceae bacterium]|nr:anaerobic ribonucleoside-triphosphate reductase [Desulfobulbaceae bacterium]
MPTRQSSPDKEALADFVIKTFRHTNNDQIAFSPEFTCCLDCGKTGRGITDTCRYCGSEKIDGITRITGYFTKISSWNKGKLGELHDRYRNEERFVRK